MLSCVAQRLSVFMEGACAICSGRTRLLWLAVLVLCDADGKERGRRG
jgi:hypothetical protein